MIAVHELRKWLDTLDPGDYVGIDEGGLTLMCPDAGPDPHGWAYIEVGGLVTEENDNE